MLTLSMDALLCSGLQSRYLGTPALRTGEFSYGTFGENTIGSDRSSGSAEYHPLHDAFWRWLAHAAEGFPAVADRLLAVPPLRPVDVVSHHP